MPMTVAEAQDIVAATAPHPDAYADYRKCEAVYLPHLCAAVFDDLPPGRVLEVGPGWGTTLVWLSSRGWECTGMDIMPRGHWMPEALMSEWGIRYIERDVFEAPRAEQFDLVICTSVISHLKYRVDRALRHLRAMTAPDGTCIVAVLNADDNTHLEAAYGCDWQAVPRWGTAPPSPDSIVCLFGRAEFEEAMRGVWPSAEIWTHNRVNYARA